LHVTNGHLLAGRLRYAQPGAGYRSGIEPVLLAASVPARAGERVLEGGSGAGATLLCLAARVPGVRGLGLERDPALVDLAQRNAADNGFDALQFQQGDIEDLFVPGPLKGAFDHVCANPPYHGEGTPSPIPERETAKRAANDAVSLWMGALSAALRPQGTLTLILSAAQLPLCLRAMEQVGCGSGALLPFWPRPGRPAKLVLLQMLKGGRGTFRVLPGLILHEGEHNYTPAAQAIIRGGSALAI
jgi:tRNA1Val (adenine37-N6)-methyltransferase